MQRQLLAGLVHQLTERQARVAQTPLQGTRAERQGAGDGFQIRPLFGQLPRQFQACLIDHAMALAEFAEQTVGVGVEHALHLSIGLAQGHTEQPSGENQRIVRLPEQHRAAKDTLVLGGIGRRRVLEAHFGRGDVQAADPASEADPAGQGFFAHLALLLGQQWLPAVRDQRLAARPLRLVVEPDQAQIAHQSGVASLSMQGVGQGGAAHDQIAQHTVITRPYGFTQVQAQAVVTTRPHAFTEQHQVGTGGDTLIALKQYLRRQLGMGKQHLRGHPQALQVIDQSLQIGHRHRAGENRGIVHRGSSLLATC